MSLLPQFGFVEMVVIAIVALIVVKPKDLPGLMRSIGQTVASARRMATEFTSAFDDMAREAEMDELRKEMDALRFDKMADEVKEEMDAAVEPIQSELDKTVKSGQILDEKPSAQLTSKSDVKTTTPDDDKTDLPS